MSDRRLSDELAALRVIVCCGSGGVGKTTVAASLACALAEEDRRILVLTIDPARRLMTALGLTDLGAEPVTISRARLRRAGIDCRGEVVAAMLDQKSTWDRMVQRYAPTQESAKRIMNNRFYQGVSDAFIGSQEYMAIETLYELNASGEYDCVVIDTPPSRNALDFLDAPDHLSDFVGARFLSWLGGGARFGIRAFNLAASPLLRLADRLVGADVLAELSEFATELSGLYGGVQQRAREVNRLLRSPVVGFVVVTTLEAAAFGEAQFFIRELRARSMPLRGVVVNRVYPDLLRDSGAAMAASSLVEDEQLPAWLGKQLETPVAADALHTIGEDFLLYHRLAVRDGRQLGQLGRLGKAPLVEIPLMEAGVSDLEGLGQIAALL